MNFIILYLQEMFLYILVAVPVYSLIRILVLRKKKVKTSARKELVLSVFFLYSMGLLSQVMKPRFFTERQLNLTPFETIYKYLCTSNPAVGDWSQVVLLNLVGNIVMFIPLGLFAPMIWKTFRSLKGIFLFALIVACSIEFTQYWIGRSTDIDDVILNVLGICIGFFLSKIRLKTELSKREI